MNLILLLILYFEILETVLIKKSKCKVIEKLEKKNSVVTHTYYPYR